MTGDRSPRRARVIPGLLDESSGPLSDGAEVAGRALAAVIVHLTGVCLGQLRNAAVRLERGLDIRLLGRTGWGWRGVHLNLLHVAGIGESPIEERMMNTLAIGGRIVQREF